MTLKFIKLIIKIYFINKFYIWIHNWAVSVKHVSSFSSTSSYQQLWDSNNLCFFTLCYLLTAPATTSAIKFTISPALFTAVVLTTISNHTLPTFNNCVWSSLNETEKQCCCDNNLCFYCKKSNHWLNNCLQKYITHIDEITFQTFSSEQLMIEVSSIFINSFNLQSENK